MDTTTTAERLVARADALDERASDSEALALARHPSRPPSPKGPPMDHQQNQPGDDKRGLIAWLRRFYHRWPITFAVTLMALSTLLIIIGARMMAAPPT